MAADEVHLAIRLRQRRAQQRRARRCIQLVRRLHHGVGSAPNAPYGQVCTDACRASITAMRDAFDWDLSRQEMAQLDALAFDAYPQSPTYYSSAGCPNSFGVSDHPTQSSCKTLKAAWC